ncbi:MAG: hypothetical protein KatS3mg113_0964 [Planctomycetaceae bacterium]|nr:MAG: hypothetical protein KatS3mg113_0964 [Planctomycetaceae bacterium]
MQIRRLLALFPAFYNPKAFADAMHRHITASPWLHDRIIGL